MNMLELMIKHKDKEPRYNKKIVNGLAYYEMKHQRAWLESVVRSISSSFIPGLTFEGITLTDPKTEVMSSYISFAQNAPGVRSRLNMLPTNTYMLDFNFSFKGERLRPARVRTIHLKLGNKMLFDGKTAFASNVAIDRGVNIKDGGLYVYMGKSSFVSYREQCRFLADGELVQETVLIADIHRAPDKKTGNGDAKIPRIPSLFGYLVAKVGLSEAAKRYFGLNIKVVEGTLEEVLDEYRPKGYTVFSSAAKKPYRLHESRWEEPNLHLLYKGDEEESMLLFASNFFYIYDAVTTLIDINNVEDNSSWTEILGRFIFFLSTANSIKYTEMANDHITRSIEKLLDPLSLRELNVDGIEVTDIYELFSWLILNSQNEYNKRVSGEFSNKRFSTMRYILAPIVHAINRLSFKFDIENKTVGKEISIKEVQKMIDRELKEGLIRQIKSNNGEIMSLQVSSTDMMLAATGSMLTQTQTSKRGKNNAGLPMYAEENFAHPSVYFNTQITGISKSNPAGRNAILPHMELDKYNNMLPNPYYEEDFKILAKALGKGVV